MSCEGQLAGGLLGRLFSFLEEYSRRKQFLLLLWPLSGPGGGQPVFTVPLKSVQFQALRLRMVCRALGGVAGSHPPRRALSPPVSTCPVSWDCKYLPCFGLWRGGGARGRKVAWCWLEQQASFILLFIKSKDLVLATEGPGETSSLSQACSLGIYIYPFKNWARLYFLSEMNTFLLHWIKQNLFSHARKSINSFIWHILMTTFILTQKDFFFFFKHSSQKRQASAI